MHDHTVNENSDGYSPHNMISDMVTTFLRFMLTLLFTQKYDIEFKINIPPYYYFRTINT